VCVSLRLADNVLLVVDVVEGVTAYCQILISLALKFRKKIVLCVNKLDRLVVELKLPPNDAYLKIQSTIDEVNLAIQHHKTTQMTSRDWTQEFISPLH
jgi:116 kDa U5 small nuclear ribonucleoprotein component